VYTDGDGQFTITGAYTISTPSYLYIVASGGNSGAGGNSDIALMAAIGGCAATSALDPSLFININEVTTAAAVLEFASNVQATPFMAAPAAGNVGTPNIGAPAANYNDLRTAFENYSSLVDISTGDVVNPTGSKGKLIYTLADILAYCVNSSPGTGDGHCTALFTDATSSGYVADTAQAAWYIAQSPTTNTSTLWSLIPGSPPFVALSSAPASFAVTAPTDFVGCFAVLGNSTVTNTATSTVVSGGDLGLYTGTSVTNFSFSSGGGRGTVTLPATHYISDTPGVAMNAQGDLTLAYDYAAGLSSTPGSLPADMGGSYFTPGVYQSSGAVGLGSSMTLDAGDDPDAVFVFQVGAALTTTTGVVNLTHGAQAQNVFWQVGTSATIGTNFVGTIMALDSISLGTGVTLNGRALASTAAVNLDDNAVTAP
jgi:hypothetical protein